MRFELEHTFPAPLETVAAALLDPAFQASLGDVGALKERTVLSQEDASGGRVTRRVRCVLDLDISGAARRFLGDADPAWVQEEEWDPAAMTWDWVIHPEIGGDLLTARGATVLRGDGTGASRTVTGDVKVHVPLYGGKVEGWIVEGVTRAYDEEAERLTRWLAR